VGQNTPPVAVISKHINTSKLGLERYWHWVIGYWAIFADIG